MNFKRLLFTIIIICAFLGCHSKKGFQVPDELIGEWNTTSKKYESCFFIITEKFFYIVNGEGRTISYFIFNIEKVVNNRWTLYTIFYEDLEGVEYKISCYYDPNNGGVIRLNNQKRIEWTKNKESHLYGIIF